MIRVSPNWFDTQYLLLRIVIFKNRGKKLKNKSMLQSFKSFLSESAFRRFYDRYDNVICQFNLELDKMLSDKFHTNWGHSSTMDYYLYLIKVLGSRWVWLIKWKYSLFLGIWSHF